MRDLEDRVLLFLGPQPLWSSRGYYGRSLERSSVRLFWGFSSRRSIAVS